MSDETQELRRLIAELSERVRRLEQRSAYGPPVQDLQPTTDAPPPPMPIPASPPPQQVSGPGTRSAVDASRSETLESRIGSQWFNRIGIVAVLVGIALALKYVFENNWVGPGIRVALGLIGGLAIASWSERFRGRGYLVFSWSLKAIGAGTLYLTLWAGVQIYHLFSPATAFTAMVVVTASIATLSLAQEAQVLAAFAMVGGFATPVLLSTGEDHELFLFSYVALLDIATVLLISRRAWTRLLLGAYFGTTIFMWAGTTSSTAAACFPRPLASLRCFLPYSCWPLCLLPAVTMREIGDCSGLCLPLQY